jgi:hypothetical protein
MGSMEVPFDPFIMEKLMMASDDDSDEEIKDRSMRAYNVARFIMKLAMRYLPPKQRKIFYSVWCRSNGKLKSGVMEFSRRTGQSRWTNYNNYKKAMTSIKNILEKTGYGPFLVRYMKGEF